jgi:hypothetical protein
MLKVRTFPSRITTHIVFAGGKYWTALQAAALSGELKILRLLIAEGADVNAEGENLWVGTTALKWD